MDLRDGVMKEYHPFRYIQFLLFFPTISSGPIDRYRRFEKDLKNPPSAEKYLDFLEKGIFYLFLGFLYKFIISHYLGGVFLPHVEKMALAQGCLLYTSLQNHRHNNDQLAYWFLNSQLCHKRNPRQLQVLWNFAVTWGIHSSG